MGSQPSASCCLQDFARSLACERLNASAEPSPISRVFLFSVYLNIQERDPLLLTWR